MATLARTNPMPDATARGAADLVRALRELAKSRTDGRCQISGCTERATFVSCTVLAPLSADRASVHWTALCVRHGSVFALATGMAPSGA